MTEIMDWWDRSPEFCRFMSGHHSCHHCGEECETLHPEYEDLHFCCDGCMLVFQLLDEKDLCTYYDLEEHPGIQQKNVRRKEKYAYLEHTDIQDKLLRFREGKRAGVDFYIPSIHCASCLWLLEKLYALKEGILSSQVNFIKKEISIQFEWEKISLRELVELLDSIGYTPEINLQGSVEDKKVDRKIIYKLGIAGFCFGNIMLLSFPEYLSSRFSGEQIYITFFAWLNLGLSLPVLLYSASDYFVSAWKGLRHKRINIDLPISIGILSVFVKSAVDIISQTGPGYLDSMAGLVFFLLIGKWYQDKTYKALSFERDFRSYFPIACVRLRGDEEEAVPIQELKEGDRILIRNGELIPADASLEKGDAQIDFSFVTGESIPVRKELGDLIYAGGRQVGSNIVLRVQKEVQQSYLTQLWNQKFQSRDRNAVLGTKVDQIAQYFTLVVLLVAVGSYAFWAFSDSTKAIFAFVSALIIACPCALALTLPFTYGNMIRIFGRHKFYLRSPEVVEKLSEIQHLALDKTGTMTRKQSNKIRFEGDLNELEIRLTKSLAANSTHPLSQMISEGINGHRLEVEEFEEVRGAGLQGMIDGHRIKLGSASFLKKADDNRNSTVHLEIDGKYKGCYEVQNDYRPGLFQSLHQLEEEDLGVEVLSGDQNSEQKALNRQLGKGVKLNFSQTPYDKRNRIEALQNEGSKVAMLGDGLNDAAALNEAHVGVAVVDDVYSFSPSSDAILQGDALVNMPKFLRLSRRAQQIVRWSFGLSFLYNVVGLSFAVQGLLSPLVAAILMPLSSVSVVLFISLLSLWAAKKELSIPAQSKS